MQGTNAAARDPAVHEARLREVVGRALGDLGAVMQAPLTLIGSRLGLYKALVRGPLTTAELADRTGTAERYVREWVHGQVAAGYVTYHRTVDGYSLTAEQALVFADETSPTYLVGGFELALTASRSESLVEDTFRSGGGIGWHEHDENPSFSIARFFEPGYRAHVVGSWIPALEGVAEKLRAGILVADVGCGQGVSTRLMAEAFPESTFLGFDDRQDPIEAAARGALSDGLEGRVSFRCATAADYPGRGYDLVTMFGCLRHLGDPVGAAMHVKQSLAPDGTWMIVEPRAGDRLEENCSPVGRLYDSGSKLICTPTSPSREAGLALGAQAGEAAIRAVVEEAGFRRFRRAAETPFNLVYEARP